MKILDNAFEENDIISGICPSCNLFVNFDYLGSAKGDITNSGLKSYNCRNCLTTFNGDYILRNQ